jgi:hypothetical protein
MALKHLRMFDLLNVKFCEKKFEKEFESIQLNFKYDSSNVAESNRLRNSE